MSFRSFLIVILLSIAIVAVTGAATAADGDQKVTIEKDNENETVIANVSSCEKYLCEVWNKTTTFDLYINGEKVESLEYDDQYRVENSSYINGSAQIAVAKTGLSGDEGWAYNVTQKSPEDQPSNEANNSRKGNQSTGEESAQEEPSTKVISDELDEFGDCLDEGNLRFLVLDESEVDYCYDKQFK